MYKKGLINIVLKAFHALDRPLALLISVLRVIQNHMNIILPSFDHPPTSSDILYALNVDKIFQPPTHLLLSMWFLNGPLGTPSSSFSVSHPYVIYGRPLRSKLSKYKLDLIEAFASLQKERNNNIVC